MSFAKGNARSLVTLAVALVLAGAAFFLPAPAKAANACRIAVNCQWTCNYPMQYDVCYGYCMQGDSGACLCYDSVNGQYSPLSFCADTQAPAP